MVVSKTAKILIIGVVTTVVIGLVVGITVGVVVNKQKSKPISVEQRAYELLKTNPLIDGHNDWAWLIRNKFQNKMNNIELYNMTRYQQQINASIHTDINRLRQGQVGGQFWSIYTQCQHQGKDATVSFLEQIDLMNRIIEKHSDVFQMTRTADEVRQAFKANRIASLYGVEGGQAIESSFSILRLFYQLGVRYMTLTHNCNTPWADQNQVDRVNSTFVKNDGLTNFGKNVVLEMNRLGMLVDLSHVAKKTMLDVLNVTQSPVIFSHSSAYQLCNHVRNVPDDVLELVKKNEGIVMVAFAPGFITCNSSNAGTVADVAAHINHIRNVASVDNVGLGGDYDGIELTPRDLEDVSKYPKLVEYLLSQGTWTDEDIIKLIGGNILRVLEKNEQIAQQLQRTMKPQEDLIELDSLKMYNLTQCRYLDMYPNAI